jgi:hypothetical protein
MSDYTPERPVSVPATAQKVSVRTRFEVLKRDSFTCRYCGRKTPEVVLQVDHVIPSSQGGSNDMENLVTACWECNSGKSDKPLSELAPVTDVEEQAILMLERERQLREYNFIKKIRREREEGEIEELMAYWEDICFSKNGFPARKRLDRSAVRSWLQRLPCEDIKEYMDIAFEKKGDWHGVPYLGGIIRSVTKQ